MFFFKAFDEMHKRGSYHCKNDINTLRPEEPLHSLKGTYKFVDNVANPANNENKTAMIDTLLDAASDLEISQIYITEHLP